MIQRAGRGTEDTINARQMLEDALLVQLPAFSVEQVASALASLQHFTPSDAARAALLTAVAEHSSSQVQCDSLPVSDDALCRVPCSSTRQTLHLIQLVGFRAAGVALDNNRAHGVAVFSIHAAGGPRRQRVSSS